MLKMWKAFELYLCLVLFAQTVAGCTYSSAENTYWCETLGDVEAKGTVQWKKVVLTRLRNRPTVAMKENSFARTPNLVELTVTALLKEIQPGAFKSLSKLDKLTLKDNDLQTLTAACFEGLHIRQLELSNDNIQQLPPGLFKHIPSIRILKMEENNIGRIPVGVFDRSTILELLMPNNKIENIEDNALANMQSLTILNLRKNNMKSFDSQKIFAGSSELFTLILSENKIEKLANNMFAPLAYLENLQLAKNQIKSIENGAFGNLSNLQLLDLSDNQLIEVHPGVFPSGKLPFMETLSLRNNQLTFVNVVTLLRMPNLKYISLGGNPFQCPCLKQLRQWLSEKNISQLCDSEYLNGQVPACIFGKVSNNSCIYDSEMEKSIRVDYSESLKEYYPINIDCDIEKVAADASRNS